MSTQASLRAAADERKARLAKLKSLKRKHSDDEVAPEPRHSPSPKPDDATTHVSGRNYDPETKGPKLGFEAPPTLAFDKATLEQQALKVEVDIKQKAAEEEQDDKGLDLFRLQPKKPNWDLKRDLDKKLELLNVRTENAIARMVKARIENAQKDAQASAGKTAINTNEGADQIGIDGIALVEGVKLREKEDEEERRQAEDDETR